MYVQYRVLCVRCSWIVSFQKRLEFESSSDKENLGHYCYNILYFCVFNIYIYIYACLCLCACVHTCCVLNVLRVSIKRDYWSVWYTFMCIQVFLVIGELFTFYSNLCVLCRPYRQQKMNNPLGIINCEYYLKICVKLHFIWTDRGLRIRLFLIINHSCSYSLLWLQFYSKIQNII